VIDFTSSLYLGMEHPSAALPPWSTLTTGRPAALGPPAGTKQVERALAALQGLEQSTLAPSTLHLAWDLFGLLARRRDTSIHVDRGAYPIVRWGVERAEARGLRTYEFAHHDAADLRRSLAAAGARGRPVIVTDGWCPACGHFAPLADYQRAVRGSGGMLVIDDTQALGIWGAPASDAPYGREGGGSPRALRLTGRMLVITSLAKAFGVPLAALSGSRTDIGAFVRASDARVHCSPPSSAAIVGAVRALAINRARGEPLRGQLAANVRRWRAPLLAASLDIRGGTFPVQSLLPVAGIDPVAMHRALAARGVRTFVTQSRCDVAPRVGFVIRADHESEHLDYAAQAVLNVIAVGRSRTNSRLDREGNSPCGRREMDTRCTSPGRAYGPSPRGPTCRVDPPTGTGGAAVAPPRT
jgi:8-amino-7-oxononanoate synthase